MEETKEVEAERTKGSVASLLLERAASVKYHENMFVGSEYSVLVAITYEEKDKHLWVKTREMLVKLVQLTEEREGKIRIVASCTACNIVPTSRVIDVSELGHESTVEFKIMPLVRGEFYVSLDFYYEFLEPEKREHIVNRLGTMSLPIRLYEKPFKIGIRGNELKISRRMVTILSITGSFAAMSSVAIQFAGGTTIRTYLLHAFILYSAIVLTLLGLIFATMLIFALMKRVSSPEMETSVVLTTRTEKLSKLRTRGNRSTKT